jgi:hypothetical protein
MISKIIQPDAKGRITLGKPAKGVIGYRRIDKADGKIVLIPMAALPACELWVHQDKEALSSVERGIRQSKEEKLAKWGSFAAYAKEE